MRANGETAAERLVSAIDRVARAAYGRCMNRRFLGLVLVSTTLACAKGGTGSPSHYAASVATTVAGDEGDAEDDDGDDDEDDDGEETGVASSEGGVEDPPESTDEGGPAQSTGVAEETTDDGGVEDDGAAESSGDEGPVGPPSSAWEACNASGCEAGSDCVGVDGLRAFESFCAPQCEVADDCFPPDDGDAVPVCAIDAEGGGQSTHCALVCEVDGEPFGTCPGGMFCIDLPGQPTPVSICMWP